MELAVHAQNLQIRLCVAGKPKYHRAVHGFEIHRRSIEHFVQLKAQVAVGGLRAETAGAIENLNVPVDRTQITTTVNATYQHTAVDGTDAAQEHAIRNVNVILDGDFDTPQDPDPE